MKNFVVSILSIFFFFTLHAQSNFYKDSSLFSLRSRPHPFSNFNPDYQTRKHSVINLNHNLQIIDPLVLKLPKPGLTYLGKGDHLEIYKSAPDNMYVVMPDSSFFLNMPVADLH